MVTPTDGGGDSDASGAVEEVEFTLSDRGHPFVGVSAAEGCEVTLQRMIPRKAGRYAEYFSIQDANPDRVLELAREHPHVDPSALTTRENGGLFEFVVDDGCPARHLAEAGALPQEVSASDGDGRIVATVTADADRPAIVRDFLERFESAELVAIRGKDRPVPLFSERELGRAMDERLTDRQQEVLSAAYEAGYYDQPRAAQAQEIAGDLGISGATFSKHIRAAEGNLIALLYEERAL